MRRFLKNRILKNLRLRFAAAVLLLTALLLSSCRGVELENKIVQVEGYTRPQAMILLANERNRYQDLYTPVIWEAKSADGTGFDRQLIDSVKSFAEQLRLICMMAEERNFSLSSTERDLIRQMSERYYGSLSSADRNYIGCSEEDVRTLYTDYFTAVRLIQSFTGDVSSEISDSEVKVIRIQLLFKSVARDIRKTVHPRSVNVIKLDGRALDEKLISGVQGYFFAAMMIVMLATVAVSVNNFDFETSFTAVIATFFNIGPGLGLVGPSGNFAIFSPLSKLVLTLCMLLGRLEIFPILMLAAPSAWEK